MTNHIRVQVRTYLRSRHGEIIHFKTFNTNVSVNEVLEETLTTTKKDVTRIRMDRDYDKQESHILCY